MHRTNDQDLATHLQHLEELLLQPQTRSDSALVASLLTGGFREFGSSGRVYTREQTLSALSDEPPAARRLTDFHCDRLNPGMALVTYRSHRRTPEGATISALRSSLWIHGETDWQMHFHQGTTEPPGASTISVWAS